MNDAVVLGERYEDEVEIASAGTTAVLAAEGWETAEYIEPGDDWPLLDDGSYLSPDGSIRTWPLGAEIG